MICCKWPATRDALELPQALILDERHRRLALRLVWLAGVQTVRVAAWWRSCCQYVVASNGLALSG